MKCTRRLCATALLCAATWCVPRAAAAQTSARPTLVAPSIELDAAEADVRTAWIQSRLDAESPAAQRWYWLSMGLLGSAAVGQAVAGLAVSDLAPNGQLLAPADRLKPALFVGAATATIGLLGLVVLPFRPAFAASELRRRPARTPEERIARMHRAEAILDDCADGESLGSGWLLHAGGILVGAGSSLVLWLGFQQSALTVFGNFALTVGFNELQILTQPTQLIVDRATYRRDQWRPIAYSVPPRRSPVRVVPMPFPGGAGLFVSF